MFHYIQSMVAAAFQLDTKCEVKSFTTHISDFSEVVIARDCMKLACAEHWPKKGLDLL